MKKYNRIRSIDQSLTLKQFKLISKRKHELFPLGLAPFSPIEDIKLKAKQITDVFLSADKKLHDSIWQFLCSQLNTSAKQPDKKNIYKRLKQLLLGAVKHAGFVYQAIVGKINLYIRDDYYQYLKKLKPKYSADFYLQYLYSKAQNKSIFAKAAQHHAKACGMFSLAQKDGLKVYLLTITLKPSLHLCSADWDGTTPDQSASKLSSCWTKLQEGLRNNNVRYEMVRNIDPHDDGTPHLHATIATDNFEKFKRYLNVAFADIAAQDERGIQLEEAKNPYAARLYTMKTMWPSSDEEGEKLMTWRSQISAQCIRFASSMRKYPPLNLWEGFRKDKFNAKAEITAVHNLEENIITTEHDHASGETYVQLPDHSRYVDRADACDAVAASLTMSARDGDFAEFTRVFNRATYTRKQLPVCKKSGLETSGSLGEIEVQGITELRTIRQVLNKFGNKIRDIEDHKWVLRNKSHGKKSLHKIARDQKTADFMQEFKESLKTGYQTELSLV